MVIHLKRPSTDTMILVIAVAVLLAPLALAAQAGEEVEGPEVEVEARGYFMVGVHSLDLDVLNRRLGQRGLPEFSSSFTTLGGGAHTDFGRFLVGGEGHALVRSAETEGGFERSVHGGYGFVNLGYTLTPTAPVQVFPLVGIGGGTVKFNTVEIGAPTFDEVLDDARRGSHLTQTSVLLQAGLGADYLIVFGEPPHGPRGLTVGVRAGYTFSPWEGDWTLDDFKVPGGPALGIEGFHLRVLVGGAGRTSRR